MMIIQYLLACLTFIPRQIAYRKKIKAMRKRDPFIY